MLHYAQFSLHVYVLACVKEMQNLLLFTVNFIQVQQHQFITAYIYRMLFILDDPNVLFRLLYKET